jgi:hypothetical protein
MPVISSGGREALVPERIFYVALELRQMWQLRWQLVSTLRSAKQIHLQAKDNCGSTAFLESAA